MRRPSAVYTCKIWQSDLDHSWIDTCELQPSSGLRYAPASRGSPNGVRCEYHTPKIMVRLWHTYSCTIPAHDMFSRDVISLCARDYGRYAGSKDVYRCRHVCSPVRLSQSIRGAKYQGAGEFLLSSRMFRVRRAILQVTPTLARSQCRPCAFLT